MADYHFIYKDTDDATTQWDEIQRKLGNLPPKPVAFKPAPFTPADDPDLRPKSTSWLDAKSPDELEDLEDDLDDDRFLEAYRKKRLAELQAAARVARFGSVVPISGSDFIREVSQAPADVWVVVFLYKDGIPDCGVLLRCLEELATRYPGTKFVKVISTDCIPNYPDRNLPTVLVYNNGAVKGTHVGLQHFGGRKCTPEGTTPRNSSKYIILAEKENQVSFVKVQSWDISFQRILQDQEVQDCDRILEMLETFLVNQEIYRWKCIWNKLRIFFVRLPLEHV